MGNMLCNIWNIVSATSCVTIVSLSLVSPVAAADLAVDRTLASQCAQCHGTDGNSVGDIDGLAGESFNELYRELLEMKRDDDQDLMHLQAKGYTNDQLARIAEYFSSLPKGDDD